MSIGNRAPRVVDPELLGVTESSVTLTFAVAGADGVPVGDRATVRVDGEPRAVSEGVAGTRLVRIGDLAPDTEHEISIETAGSGPAAADAFFPGRVTTLPAPRARQVASFATLNDLHFGEPHFGGTLLPDGDFGGAEAPGFGMARESDGDVPYWLAMNEDAVADVNASGADLVVIKGDIADRGRREQFEVAARTFSRFAMPHHAFLGNHDHYALHDGETVDGCALLGQPPAHHLSRQFAESIEPLADAERGCRRRHGMACRPRIECASHHNLLSSAFIDGARRREARDRSGHAGAS